MNGATQRRSYNALMKTCLSRFFIFMTAPESLVTWQLRDSYAHRVWLQPYSATPGVMPRLHYRARIHTHTHPWPQGHTRTRPSSECRNKFSGPRLQPSHFPTQRESDAASWQKTALTMWVNWRRFVGRHRSTVTAEWRHLTQSHLSLSFSPQCLLVWRNIASSLFTIHTPVLYLVSIKDSFRPSFWTPHNYFPNEGWICILITLVGNTVNTADVNIVRSYQQCNYLNSSC